MRKTKNIFANIDILTIFLYAFLVFFGWLNIYASEYNDDYIAFFNPGSLHAKQLLFIAISFFLAFIILIIDWKFFDSLSFIFYFTIIGLLLGVLLFGSTTSGATSWFEIGRFKFQPSEFSKFITALALAKYLDLSNNRNNTWAEKVKPYIIILTPFLLIILQNDLGTALVFSAFALVLYRQGMSSNILVLGLALIVLVILCMLINQITLIIFLTFLGLFFYLISKKGKKEILFIVKLYLVSVFLILGINYTHDNLLRDHHVKRIDVLLGKEIDPQGAGYNLIQSKIAIGSGGLFGKGFVNGTQTRFDFVPEQSTDFIFCTIGEEWGFFGSVIFISIFLSLILRILFLAERQRSNFSRVYGYSVACILFFHFLINVGMTIGLTPVIGIPLPFISYGGSSLLGFTILLFIFLNFDSYRLEILR